MTTTNDTLQQHTLTQRAAMADHIEGATDCRKLAALERTLLIDQKSHIRWALAALAMPFLAAAVYSWEQGRHAQVLSSEPIGQFVDLQPASAQTRFGPVVQMLSTGQGFFSLLEPLSLARGEAVVLEQRASGRWYVCAADRRTCARTLGIAGS